MPSFFGYIAWSGAFLLPLYLLLTFLFFIERRSRQRQYAMLRPRRAPRP